MRYIKLFDFMLIILLLLLASCRAETKYIPVKKVNTEYIKADTTAIYARLLSIFESKKEKELKSDSLIDREKLTVVLNLKGDTVKETKTRYVYRATQREKELERENKTLKDSISSLNTRLESIKTDSVPSIMPVERELSKWEKAKMDFGGMAIGGSGVLFIGSCVAVVWLIKGKRK